MMNHEQGMHHNAPDTTDSSYPKSWVRFQQNMRDADISRLSESLNPSSGLFDRQLREGRWQSVARQEVLTSTAINLIALHRAQVSQADIHLDAKKSLTMLTDAYRMKPYPGGIGLIVWANAVWDALDWQTIAERCSTGNLQERHALHKLTTMELAWLIAGALHQQRRVEIPWCEPIIEDALQILKTRFCRESGLFMHADNRSTTRHRSRKGISNFADQIYAIFALSLLSISKKNKFALEMANQCAGTLVAKQGELGQWWWHYHTRSGKIAQSFPVYSVHQRAMAPMALLALKIADGDSFDDALEKGARWIERNEMGISLVDNDAGTVWRDIELEEWLPLRWARLLKSVASQSFSTPLQMPFHRRSGLRTNHETRPYEWGWSLYAAAIEQGGQVPPHII